jgi:serine/alanine adding enzyme
MRPRFILQSVDNPTLVEQLRDAPRFINVVGQGELCARLSAWEQFVAQGGVESLNHDPRWLLVLLEGRGHTVYCLEAIGNGQVSGILPLALVESRLFGRFLVSLPHVSGGGICCEDKAVALALVDRAVALADELDVDFLELRSDRLLSHPRLQHIVTDKAHMRMELPANEGQLWARLGSKVRNQVRKAEQFAFQETWGGAELLDDFYWLYARRMRDFGTPVDGKLLFERILTHFAGRAEIVVVRRQQQPVASAMVLHGNGISEMHRSAALTDLRPTAVNTWLHWQALLRSLERGSRQFDFGRPTVGSSVYTFKKRFGAAAQASAVQHYLRRGSPSGLRRASGRFDFYLKMWSCLPVCVTRWIGPMVARRLP